MENLNDEGKKIDPLFPRLHISDADKFKRSQRCLSGSVPILPLSTNNGSSLGPATSSYHDASYKRSVFSSFGSSLGSTRLATRLDSYHAGGINLNISLTTVKQTIETTNCQTLCNSGHLKPSDYCLFKPQSFTNTRNTPVKKLENEDDYLVPNLPFGKSQHSTNRGKLVKHKDATQENKLNTTRSKNIIKEPTSSYYYDNTVCFSDTLNGEISSSNPRKRRIVVDDSQMLQDSNIRWQLKRRTLQENLGYKDGVLVENGTRNMSILLEDAHKTDIGTHEVFAPTNNIEEEDRVSLRLGDMGKAGDVSDTNSGSGNNATPEEVSQIIGPEQYCEARRTIIQQQRVFQSQLFELHRLIKVQHLLARSPDLLLEDSFYKLKKPPSEDILPKINYNKKETYLGFPIDTTIRKPLHTNNDTDYNPNSINLPPPPPSLPTVKQPPWCFLPPQGNQWLVPVTSPSEGLVYKPYTGLCPPPVGVVAPVYSMGLTPSNVDFLTNIGTTYQHGINIFPSAPVYTPYGFPITKSCSPRNEDNLSYKKPIKTSCNILVPEKWTVSSEGENMNDNKLEINKGGDELPLFPTAPIFKDSDQCIDEKGSDEKIKAIKVIPHNLKLASESAARIFQFIQEERKHYE